jgi:CRISPR-associated protein Csa1
MYFLTEQERRLLLRRYLPEIRQTPVSGELRGWNWASPPVAPVYGAALSVEEAAGRACASGRDVYLRHVLHQAPKPGRAQVDGAYYHRIVAEVMLRAKRAIYEHGAGCLPALEALETAVVPATPPGASASAEGNAPALWRYEARRISARAADAVARLPGAGADALCAAVLPITLDQQLDGTFLGLGRGIAVDAVHFCEPMVAGLQFGRRERFHRIALAGYALVVESLLEQPINLGYTVYIEFQDGHVVVEREFHVLNDELRQWFLDERDEKARSIELELDPGLADECPEDCPYWSACYAA